MAKLFWIIVIFLIIGALVIIKSQNYEPIEDVEDRKNFVKDFGKWLFKVGKSTKNTVGYVIDQEWLPKVNKTNTTINKTGDKIW